MRYLSLKGVTSLGADIVTVVILALFTVASVAAFIVFLCKYSGGGDCGRKKSALAVILCIGFTVRLILALCIRGGRADYKVFTDMFDHLKNHGLAGYYNGDPSGVLYPVVYFVYLIFGGLSNVTGLSSFALGAQFMVKLPIIAADLLIAFAVYKLGDRYFNAKIGLTLAAFVCVCPIFFIGSSGWTSPIVITAMFICFACYFLARKNFAVTVLFSMLAAFSGKEGIYILPVIAVFSATHFVRAAKTLRARRAGGDSENKSVMSRETNALITVPVSIVLSFVAVYALGLFMTASYSANPFVYIYEFVIAPLVDWTRFTANGVSVYAIFGQNGAERSARFPAWVFVAVFTAIIVAVTCIVYFSKRNRATLVMLAAYALFTMQIYYPNSTAVGMEVALPVLLAAYALVRDKRLLTVLFVTGTAFVINSLSSLAVSGFLGNADDYLFNAASDYPSVTLLTGGLSAIPIVCSVLAVLSHLYFTVVAISVGMTGVKKQLASRNGFGASLKEYFTGKN